jgi:hypothetical protein
LTESKQLHIISIPKLQTKKRQDDERRGMFTRVLLVWDSGVMLRRVLQERGEMELGMGIGNGKRRMKLMIVI